MSAILDPQHTCPKCRQTYSLSAFKLRSHRQGHLPAWCKDCRNRQDCDRRAHQRERAINEAFRRIRLQTPPDQPFAHSSPPLLTSRVAGQHWVADFTSGSKVPIAASPSMP